MEPEHPRLRELINERGIARLTYLGGLEDDFSPARTDATAPNSPLHQSTSFSFPSLARDGSTLQQSDQASPRQYPTPPAALSSKGAAAQGMASNMSSSINSLDDGNYDMVDDASDTSIDHPETASLPSTTDHSDDDDGIDTPDETGSIIDVAEELDFADRTLTLGGSHETLPGVQDGAERDAYSPAHDEVMDSFLRDDLETPRQSTMYPVVEKTPGALHKKQESPSSTMHKDIGRMSSFSTWFGKIFVTDTENGLQPKLWTMFSLMMFVVVFLSWDHHNTHSFDQTVDVVMRREALSRSVTNFTGSSDAPKLVNITHLIPALESEDLPYEQEIFIPRTAVIRPNHLLLSLPRTIKTGRYQHPVDPELTKAGQRIGFNLTRLIDGVWIFSIDPDGAHGPVDFNMKLTARTRPLYRYVPLSFTEVFGHRSFQHTTTDLSKALNKEIIVARERVNSLKDLIELEVVAGVAATRNVVTEVAVYVARDVQVFANATVSFVRKTSHARRQLSDQLSRNIAGSMEVALSTLGNNTLRLSNAVASTALTTRDSAELTLRHSKKLLHDGLVFSRQKALSLKARLTGHPQFANSTSATKELSLRFQNLFNPTDKTRRAGSLPDIARCATAPDYAACRREQRRLAAALQRGRFKDVVSEVMPAKEPKGLSFDPNFAAANVETKDLRAKRGSRTMEREMKGGVKQKDKARKGNVKRKVKLG